MQWKFSFLDFFFFQRTSPVKYTSSVVSSGMCVFVPSVSWCICFAVLLCRQNSSNSIDISENMQEWAWQLHHALRSAANHRSSSANLCHKSKRNVTQFFFLLIFLRSLLYYFFPIGCGHSRQMISSKILTIFTNFLQKETKNGRGKKSKK